jgi:two-component system chemotaxis sensor kinase CheA
VLRLGDGGQRIAYAAREVLDIATLTGRAQARQRPRPQVVGVTMIDGETAELVDCHALFAGHAAQSSGHGTLTCRLNGDETWMRNFPRADHRGAGYRIVARRPGDIAFLDGESEDDRECEARGRSACADLPGTAGGVDSIYRYDRAGLMACPAARRRGACRMNEMLLVVVLPDAARCFPRSSSTR